MRLLTGKKLVMNSTLMPSSSVQVRWQTMLFVSIANHAGRMSQLMNHPQRNRHRMVGVRRATNVRIKY